MDSLVRLLVMLATGYAAICAVVYLLQDRLILFPRSLATNPAGPHVQPVTLERPDATLAGWVVKPDAAGPVVVYFGGNAEEVSDLADVFARLDATTLLVNYRGFGNSSGSPSPSALVDDALAVVDTLARPYTAGRPLVLFGRSLGSSIAASLTRAVHADAIILMSPFRSLRHMAERLLPWLPTGWLLRHQIDVVASLDAMPAEALVLYSPEDRVVPAAETRALLAQFPRAPRVVEFHGDHNVPLTHPVIWREVDAFVHSVARGAHTGASP